MNKLLDLSVYLVLDPDQCGGHQKSVELARKALNGGVTILQLRAPNWHKKALLELAIDLLAVSREFNVLFLVDDHIDVAIACDADGVHVGQRDLSPEIVRKLIGHGKIVGYSVSSNEDMKRAIEFGSLIDYIGIGPVFSTKTKPDHNPPISLDGLKQLCSIAKHPTVAIGGITLENGVDVLKCGTNGLAIVSGICMAKDPEEATNKFLTLFKKFGQRFKQQNRSPIPTILTIAGSDSSGGAGVQADLKTFGALRVFGLSVLTTITAQNNREVRAAHALDAQFVKCQLETVFDDLQVDAVKIGALANEEIVHQVADFLNKQNIRWIVLDPVLISTSKCKLMSDKGKDALIQELLPLCTILTPNLPEAAEILNEDVATTEHEIIEQGRKLLELGPKAILMKGGHLEGDESPDWLISKDGEIKFEGKRIKQLPSGHQIGEIHGTGCTISSAITAFLVKTNGDLIESIRKAKQYLNKAILASDHLQVCKGPLVLNHFP